MALFKPDNIHFDFGHGVVTYRLGARGQWFVEIAPREVSAQRPTRTLAPSQEHAPNAADAFQVYAEWIQDYPTSGIG